MGILSVFCIYDTIGTDVNIVSKKSSLDDFGIFTCTKVKRKIRPASYVAMVVGSIYCDKIVHTKKKLLSTK